MEAVRAPHPVCTPDTGGEASAGDDAFTELYRRCGPAIYRYCFARLRHASDAEDATAQTFLQALAAVPRFQRDAARDPVPWLFRIAATVVADRARAARRRPATEPVADELPDVAEGPETAALRRSEAAALWEVVGTLPPAQRTVLTLRFAAGLSCAEVATVLGKRPGATRTELWRALRALRARLSNAGEEDQCQRATR